MNEDDTDVLTVPRGVLKKISEPWGTQAEAEGSNTAFLLFSDRSAVHSRSGRKHQKLVSTSKWLQCTACACSKAREWLH